MEISRFEEDVGGGVGDAAVEAAKHAADAHWLLGVANHQVALGECAFNAIESDKLGAFGAGIHNHLVALHLGEVEAVERLVESEQYEVGDVNNVVDWALSDGAQQVLEPLRALAHLHAADGQTTIARTSLGVFNTHLHGSVGTVDGKAFSRWLGELIRLAVLLEPGSQVASHAVVRSAVDAIRCEVHLNHIIVLYAVVVARRGAHRHVVGQHDDAAVVGAHANLVLGANHATRLNATDFRLLDGKLLVAIVEFGAHSGNNHLLTGSHVGRAAHNLGGLAVAKVNSGDVQVVAVGMFNAGEHLANHKALQTALDSFNFFYAVGFEAQRCERCRHLLGCKLEIEIAFQPFI